MTNNENAKVEQPFFEVMDLRTHKPKYHKDGSIKWKELKTKKGKPLRKKDLFFSVDEECKDQTRLYCP